MFKRLIASLVCFTFSFSNLQYVQAQGFSVDRLPVPGSMITTTPSYVPLILKGLIVHPENALKFDFLMDTGNSSLTGAPLKDEALNIMKYFLTALTIPEDDLWVNLSPYEKGRIIQNNFGQTLMGRDLLAEDYILKQLTASLIYPEKALGKEFWQQVYSKAVKEYGTTQIPVNTFNKVWIVPSQAVVWEHEGKVLIVKNHLKVMLEEDYLSLSKHVGEVSSDKPNSDSKVNSLASSIVRKIILPVLEKEVNEGKNFAQLRQMYQAMILATWYKKALRESILNKVYSDQKKTKGIDGINAGDVESIYQQYLKAFKKGAFNYIKEDIDPSTGQEVPKKYFSGGFSLRNGLFTLATSLLVWGATLTNVQAMDVNHALENTGTTILVKGNLIDVGPEASNEVVKQFEEVPSLQGQNQDLAMASKEKKLLFSQHAENTVETTGIFAALGGMSSVPLLIMYWLINAAIYDNFASWNQTQGQFLKSLAINSYGAFKLVIQDPNSYKLAAVGVGLGVALLAWQNYSLQGLSALLKKRSTDDEEVIKRLKRKEGKAVVVLMEFYRQQPDDTDGILSFLIAMDDKRAIEPIIDVLSRGKGNFEKANEALQKLGAGRETIFQANLKALETTFKDKAIEFLGDFGDSRAIGEILNILSKGEYVEHANEALQKLGADQESVFQANLKSLSTHQDDKRTVEFLGGWGDVRAIGGIADALGKGYYIEECNEALQRLGASKEVFFQAYLKLASNEDKDKRRKAIEWLGNSGDKRSIYPLLNDLNYVGRWSDDGVGVRTAAKEGLFKLGVDKEMLFQAYLGMARSVSEDIRTEAIEWLGNSGDKRAIGSLIENLSHIDYRAGKEIRIKAKQSLEKLGVDKETLFQAYLSMVINKDKNAYNYNREDKEQMQKEAIIALGDMGDQRAIKPLVEMLNKKKENSISTRKLLASVLKKLGKGYKFSKREIVLVNLSDRESSETLGNLFDFEEEAYRYAEEGYDFKVIFEPQQSHWESSSMQYDPGSDVIDSPEVLRIERGDKLKDWAMLSATFQKGLNFDLVNTALGTSSIPVNEIKDKKLSSFLDLLNEHGISDLIVVGGAVRDIFFGQEIHDIDIGVKVQMTDEERRLAGIVGVQATKQMYERAWSALNQLAQVLNIPVERFFDKDNSPQYNGVKVHYLGPDLVPAKEGRKDVIIQGLIADTQTGNVYSSYTAPSLLQMGIDSNGRLYGYQQPLQDALNGKVHMQGDLKNGRNLSLLAIIKWLRLKYAFGLSLAPEDYLLVRKVLSQKENKTIVTNKSALTHQAMQELIDAAINPQGVLLEMNELGLIQLTDFNPRMTVRTTPENPVANRIRAWVSKVAGYSSASLTLTPIMAQADDQENVVHQWVSVHPGTTVFSVLGVFALGLTYYLWKNYTLTGIISEVGGSERQEKLREYLIKQDFESLIALLKYPLSSVREATIKRLAELGNKAAIEPLLGLINGDQSYYIVKAINQLGASKEQIFLMNMSVIKSNHWSMFEESFKALAEIGDRRAIGPLVELMTKGNLNPNLIEALKKLGASKEEMFQGYYGAAESGNRAAMEELGLIGDQRAKEVLLQNLIENSYGDQPRIIRPAVEALNKLKASKIEMLSGYKIFLFSEKKYPSDENKNLDSVKVVAAKEIINLSIYEHEDILKKLLDRQPKEAQGRIMHFVKEAIQYKEQGFDFKVVFKPETGHNEEDTSTGYSYSTYVMDTAEVLEIERGDKLDRAMAHNEDHLGGITLDAAMLDLQIKRDGNGVPLSISQQPLDKINIQGFFPQIISIQPVNLQELLGTNSQNLIVPSVRPEIH